MSPQLQVQLSEGHLGGYVIDQPAPGTWCPRLWQWCTEVLGVSSVLSVGCGLGYDIEHFRSLGCSVAGVDGSPSAVENNRVPDSVVRHDYTLGPWLTNQKFDLVWSAEFVEHVEECFLPNFLSSFATATKFVLITHAVPGQEGHHHVNCRSAEYWKGALTSIDFTFQEDLTLYARTLVPETGQEGCHFRDQGLVFVRRGSGVRVNELFPPSNATSGSVSCISATKEVETGRRSSLVATPQNTGLGARRSRILESTIFDSSYYASNLGISEDDAIEHYLAIGYHKRLSPHILFDSRHYTKSVGVPEDDSEFDALYHYMTAPPSKRGNPHPLFDEQYYLESNLDVAGCKFTGLEHYILYGYLEARSPSPLFDISYLRSKLGIGADVSLVSLLTQPHLQNVSPSPIFDCEYYTAQCQDPLRSHPLVHFMTEGWRTGYSPHPYFDVQIYLSQWSQDELKDENPLLHYLLNPKTWRCRTHLEFDGEWYLERNHDVAQSGINPLLHFVVNGIAEGRFGSASPPGTTTLVRKGFDGCVAKTRITLSDLIVSEWIATAHIEPNLRLEGPHSLVENLRMATDNAHHVGRVGEILKVIPQSTTHLFLVNQLSLGGVDAELCQLIRAVRKLNPDNRPAILVTDSCMMKTATWFEEGTPIASIQIEDRPLPRVERVKMLRSIYTLLNPRVLHICNSVSGWELLRQFGIGTVQKSYVYTSVYCEDYDREGFRIDQGARFLLETVQYLSGILTDSHFWAEHLRQSCGLLSQDIPKIQTLYYPSRSSAKIQKSIKPHGSKFRVLWAGRIAPQKRVSLALQIAELCPWADFSIAGIDQGQEKHSGTLGEDSNVTILGPYLSLEELNPQSYDCFLYTARWDGLPNVLIEVGSYGLPIIAPAIAGIPELVNDTTGYLVHTIDDAQSYAEALKHLAESPAEGARRADNMKTLINQRHTLEGLCARLRTLPGYDA